MAPFHPFVEDTEQGRLTIAARETNESQYGLRMSKDFLVTGIATFSGGIGGSLRIPGGIRDTDGEIGSSGQLLSSTGSGLNWIDANTTNVNSATNVGVNDNSTDAEQWVTFVGANNGNNPIRVNNSLRYNPSTNQFTKALNAGGDVGIALSVFHLGNTAASIRFPADDVFTIHTANTERVRVGAGGSVGIGTDGNSTRARLHVYSDWVGPIHAESTTANGSYITFADPNTTAYPDAVWVGAQGNTFNVWTSNTDRRFTISPDGKFAFFPGTGSSGAASTDFHFQGHVRIEGKLIDGDNTFGTSGQVLSSDGTDLAWINAGSLSAGAASEVAVNANGDNSSQFVTFVESNSGNNAIRVDGGLKYNPNSNALTAGSFVKSGGTSGQFLKADGSVDTNTYLTSDANTTYDLSVPNTTTKIRLAGSDSTNDDVEIAGSGSITVTRTNANKLTISGTDTNTQLSTEQVQDIVGGMVSGNTETNMSVTYDDTNGKLDFSGSAASSPGGSDTQFQWNDNGSFAGAPGLKYSDASSGQAQHRVETTNFQNSNRCELDGRKIESSTTSTTALNGNFSCSLTNGHVFRYTSNTFADYTPNFIMVGSIPFNDDTNVGDVLTVTLFVKVNGHKILGIKIDNSTANIDLDWVGGSAPAATVGSAYDMYTFIIMKTASTPAYHVVASKIGVG